jgi:hypothetical protein
VDDFGNLTQETVGTASCQCLRRICKLKRKYLDLDGNFQVMFMYTCMLQKYAAPSTSL